MITFSLCSQHMYMHSVLYLRSVGRFCSYFFWLASPCPGLPVAVVTGLVAHGYHSDTVMIQSANHGGCILIVIQGVVTAIRCCADAHNWQFDSYCSVYIP